MVVTDFLTNRLMLAPLRLNGPTFYVEELRWTRKWRPLDGVFINTTRIAVLTHLFSSYALRSHFSTA